MARTNVSGPGRVKVKYSRTVFTTAHKLAIVTSFEELSNVRAVIDNHYPSLVPSMYEARRKLIYQWKSGKDAPTIACTTSRGAARKNSAIAVLQQLCQPRTSTLSLRGQTSFVQLAFQSRRRRSALRRSTLQEKAIRRGLLHRGRGYS